MAISEAVGYVPDQPSSRTAALAAATAAGLSDRAANFTWLADDMLLAGLFERVKNLLPSNIGGGDLTGLNARWRFYRYSPGAVYRPHIDGAWPASALRPRNSNEKDAVEEYVYDAHGDQRSRLTFLLYLNEDFDGGCTTFFTANDVAGVVNARGVAPRAGSVLCFPHGDGAGSLVHEGSALLSGRKYIVRTDVLYKVPARASKR